MADDLVTERVWDDYFEDCLFVEEERDGHLTLVLSTKSEDRITLGLESVKRLRRALARYERKASQ